MHDLKDHRAVVTGASSGIGAAFARQLAVRGCDLVLAARRLDRLETLATELRAGYGIKVACVQSDLGQSDGPRALFARATAEGPIDILINNAGLGDYQEFLQVPWDNHAALLQVNVTALVELTYLFTTAMVARDRRAYVLNVASMAAYQPVPYFANYAASKAYVRSFSESLAYELRRSPVTVTCLCPGGVRTEFFAHSGQEGNLGSFARSQMMSAERCAGIGLRAMLRGRRNIVSGLGNAVTMWLARFVPRRALARSSVMILGVPPPPAPADAPAKKLRARE